MRYFVSYYWQSKQQCGWGNMQWTHDILGVPDVKKIAEWVVENSKDERGEPITSAAVINFTEFESSASSTITAIRSLLDKEYPDGGVYLKREIKKLLNGEK